MEEKETVIEDAAIVAYLLLQGLEIIPFKKSDSRIAFLIRGDIAPAIQEIYQNKDIGIHDYIKALKSVRNAIFTLKGLKQ